MSKTDKIALIIINMELRNLTYDEFCGFFETRTIGEIKDEMWNLYTALRDIWDIVKV